MTVQNSQPNNVDALRKQAFDLSCNDQYRLATFIAENVGYWLAPELDHPDSPHQSMTSLAGDPYAKDIADWCQRSLDEARGRSGHLETRPFVQNVELIIKALRAYAAPTPSQPDTGVREAGFVKPDNDRQVFFYEQDFYVLSNFSAFDLRWAGLAFPTSEHAYHWEKFNSLPQNLEWIARDIRMAPSAHEAFKLADRHRQYRRSDWDASKVPVMRLILRAKADQHEYVRRKLLATGDRELIEDSWRDDFWGWGPNRDGKNMLGKLWMEIRSELRAALPPDAGSRKPALDPATVEATDLYAWPVGCHSPNSCHRNGRCMYVGCKHDGTDITALARAALAEKEGA